MGSSESQPKAAKTNRPREGSRHRPSSGGGRPATPQPSAAASASPSGGGSPPNRRPTIPELLAKVRDGIATTHSMLTSIPDGEGGQVRGELERRLMVLLSYEERLVMAQQQEEAGLATATTPRPAEKKKTLHPAVAQCPRITYTEEHLTSEEEEKRQCSICWEDYAVGEKVLILPCLHWVHAACGEDWLLRKPQCPICQLDIVQSLRNCATYHD